MGFTRMVCKEALEQSKGDVEVAARWILKRQGGSTTRFECEKIEGTIGCGDGS